MRPFTKKMSFEISGGLKALQSKYTEWPLVKMKMWEKHKSTKLNLLFWYFNKSYITALYQLFLKF